MRRDLIKIGRASQQQIGNAESAIDTGTAASAELLATLLRGRLELGLAASTETAMIEDTFQMVAVGLDFRRCAQRVHDRLGAIAYGAGLTSTVGDSGDKDLGSWFTRPAGRLTELKAAS